VLELPATARDALVAHCVAALPDEGCGLLVGRDDDVVVRSVPARNTTASALRYELDAGDHLAADRAARADGLEVLGAYHSHTHTAAYPSPTDVVAAVDPAWHWVVVSLRDADAVVRSFRIVHGMVTEERVAVVEP
jgi:proteasome lid subunit RPN8/RPN11